MGRPKGSLNRVTQQAREFARQFLDSEDYRASIERRIKNDALPGGVEVMLWYYAFGKPTDKIEVILEGADALHDMTEEQLAEAARVLSVEILEAQALRGEALDPELNDPLVH